MCKGKDMGFININKIGNTYFDRRKLHLNKSETSILIINESDNNEVHNLQ